MLIRPLPGLDLLGCGYNVLGNYADPSSVTLPFFDLGGLSKTVTFGDTTYQAPEWLDTNQLHNQSSSTFESVFGSTVEIYQTRLNSSTNLKGSYKFFTGALDVNFDRSSLLDTRNDFVTVRNVQKLWSVELPAKLPLLENANADLQKMVPSDFFGKYGTHYIQRAIIGGRADFSCATDSSKLQKSFNIEATAKAAFAKAVSLEQGVKNSSQVEQLLKSSTTRLVTIGGSTSTVTKMNVTDPRFPEAFQEWSESVKGNPVLVGFDGFSLKPLWELGSLSEDRKREFAAAYAEYMFPQPKLQVVVVGDLKRVGTDQGSGANKDLSIFKPSLEEGYYWVGHYAQRGYSTVATGTSIKVKALTRTAVAPPIDYQKVWDDKGSGAGKNYSCWKPIPPTDYQALGYVMRLGVKDQSPPSGDEFKDLVCIHKDLLTEATVDAKEPIWNDQGSGADNNVGLWRIVPKEGSDAYTAGTFYAQPNYDKPKPTSPLYCIDKKKLSS